ncbi:COQ9 family protein [Robiginitomaculum antarcticum]|uniref:COQ9 family protein n=1 Tax=Robiginitomaculum antarcticum TaxID=437507 RepID=UPI0003680E6F|nr:COQ9 family protein [Robiginitomaculum antarcticum]
MSKTQTKPDPSKTARQSILDAALPIAAFDGWTSKTLREAVAAAGLPKGAEKLYFPSGPVELITFWTAQCDSKTAEALSDMDLASMKIRERVTQGVIARLSTTTPHRDAARRALARLSLPSAGTAGPRSLWAAADTIWRAIGDTSTDANYYSKRAVLSAVIASTNPVWLSDLSDDKADARAFLDNRIENVMQFEKVKARARKFTGAVPNPAGILGRLRHGGARKRSWRRR